jgi:hypothetical protein
MTNDEKQFWDAAAVAAMAQVIPFAIRLDMDDYAPRNVAIDSAAYADELVRQRRKTFGPGDPQKAHDARIAELVKERDEEHALAHLHSFAASAAKERIAELEERLAEREAHIEKISASNRAEHARLADEPASVDGKTPGEALILARYRFVPGQISRELLDVAEHEAGAVLQAFVPAKVREVLVRIREEILRGVWALEAIDDELAKLEAGNAETSEKTS